jgi:hypothetical protein
MSDLRSTAGWIDAYDGALTRYQEIRSAGAWVTGPSSLLGVLDRRRAEPVHRDVLRWLLDPEGGHRLGVAVLERFLRAVDVAADPQLLGEASVTCEVEAYDVDEDITGAVDIVIQIGERSVLIEMKMWATETNNQLDRYAAAHPGAALVFLTPFGSRPLRSPRSGDRWQRLSWRRDIVPLLSEVREEASGRGLTVPALDDYIIALREEVGS